MLRQCRRQLARHTRATAPRQPPFATAARYLSSFQDNHSLKGTLGVPIPLDEVGKAQQLTRRWSLILSD